MRSASAILFATGILCAGWAYAQDLPQAPRAGLPGATLDEAGQAAGFGQFLCGLPGGQIEAFRHKVDSLTSGGSHSTDFQTGEARARKLISQVRQSDADNGDTRELRDSSCGEAMGLIARTLALP